jgi:hypothetical protein
VASAEGSLPATSGAQIACRHRGSGPSHGHHGRAGMTLDGRVGGDRDAPFCSAGPARHGPRGPVHPRIRQDLFERWQLLTLVARAFALSRRAWWSRLIECRSEPLKRRIGLVAHHDQLSDRQPGPDHLQRPPRRLQQRARSTRSVRALWAAVCCSGVRSWPKMTSAYRPRDSRPLRIPGASVS